MNEQKIFADLHIHSKYSRATSKALSLENLEKYARIKGVGLLGTGDFQHAKWFEELDKLDEKDGLVYTKSGFPFLWQTEISLMYSQDKKGRRIHYVLLAPNKEIVKQITEFLGKKGRLDYDGRPIFGFSSMELVDEMISISKDIEIIPAHCMTPWFGIFGSKSGFNSLKECFQDKEKEIHAVESGMSADPELLRNFSFLNEKSIVSFSDLHSFWPWRIGRECTIFGGELKYQNILKQIRENSFEATVETEPAYGRYHWDGHRICKFSCSPKETAKLKGICPICKKPLTIGVENRVDELKDQNPKGFNNKPYYKLIPLHELVALHQGSTLSSKKTWSMYNKLIEKFGSEFDVLLNVKEEDLLKIFSTDKRLVDLILQNRKSNLKIEPGYDGEYGKIILSEKQKTLF